MTRTILLTQGGDGASNYWTVQEGKRSSGDLSWDEMLGQVASLTIPSRARTDTGLYGMRTPEEMAEQSIRFSRRRHAPLECDLPPVALESLKTLIREHGMRGGDRDELLPPTAQPNARIRYAMLLLQALDTARGATALPAPSTLPNA